MISEETLCLESPNGSRRGNASSDHAYPAWNRWDGRTVPLDDKGRACVVRSRVDLRYGVVRDGSGSAEALQAK